ncbi:DUF4129 domain-containing protein [Puia dinghuensis]|uniref:Protein-glutamine gamma-glutamyltransferase-like C-terminal domain-containing protein n=1 Tax=Puia dinghuensis TaxID=1792502 RepID=A0A8J2XPG5_9BACT|nr:DUF4129 domain-containing protein [Puia dinghuensis]GGA87980.1 hypothetical protein GCM10011511_08890 [Puia dinghuensis]
MMMRRFFGMLFLFLPAGILSVSAQGGGKTGGTQQCLSTLAVGLVDGPDTVRSVDTTVNDTIIVGGDAPADVPVVTHIDTSYSASPEAGDSTASADQQPPVLRSLPDSTVHRWQRDPDYAYANDPAYWKIRRQEPSAFSLWLAQLLFSQGFRYTVLLLLGALLLYAIVRISMENNVSLFYRRRSKKGAAGDEFDESELEEDVDERIQHFLNTGDKRQATRYLYRKSLYMLRDRQLIRWHAESTNQEYLRQLKGTPPEAAFRFLTGAYEMVWYGEFVLSEATFRRLYEHFIQFYKTLEA